MPHAICHLGIDLGTTNTVAVVFDGDKLEVVRTTDGGALTPSVVRVDNKGRVTVGSRARKLLDRDPDNTAREFKRLMGTGAPIRFPAAGLAKRPEELAADVLGSVRHDVREQLGFLPERAVISVPALFELPQTAATSHAAQLAGFAQVELIQEPVASALAAGWTAADDAGGSWLVYDLGGGTFDVSLLETREGLLRVVGHDGDNFLGGRDIDQGIVRWVLARLAQDGHAVDPADPKHAAALRVLRSAAEDAKIDLSRTTEATISLPALFVLGGTPVDVDLTLDRAVVEALTAPIVDRSLAVCRRLLASHGLAADQLQRVVLVGGPTVVPFLRDRVRDALGAPFADGIDPMALVARGAAIYAATANLDARPAPVGPEGPTSAGRRLWLEYPTMTPDPTPFVVGRVLDGPEPAPTEVRFVRDGEPAPAGSSASRPAAFATEWAAVGPDGTLVAMVECVHRRPNTFAIEGRDAAKRPVPVVPAAITIVCGMTLSDPPLSRSIGIALAGNKVWTYLERGAPLPAKRTYVHHSVETVPVGSSDAVLHIPIVQGEMPDAHLCRLVGRLEITGKQIRATLPAGSDVEVTLEVDRGGRLSARALVPALSQVFEQVAHLSIADADPSALGVQATALGERLAMVRKRPIGPAVTDRLVDVEWMLQDAGESLGPARGGDADAAQRARRLLIEVDAALGELEEATRWPELEQRVRKATAIAGSWVSQLGTPHEQRQVTEATAAAERALEGRQAEDVERQVSTLDRLAVAAYYRHPSAWQWQFEQASADLSRTTDLPRAQALVQQGRAALAAGDTEQLRNATLGLRNLLPAEAHPLLAHGPRSGLR